MSAKFYDTLLWEYIKNPWVRWITLDKLSQKDFWYRMINHDDLTNKNKINFSDVALKQTSIYSWEIVYIANKLYQKHLKEKTNTNKVLNEIEIPLIKVLKKMEIDGVHIDSDILKWIGTKLENEIIRLKKSIYEEVEEEFNINSPKQVGDILFWKLALPKWKKTKTWFSVWAEVLLELAHDYEIAQKIIDYRHYTKLLSTYIDWLLAMIDDNWLVHTDYNSAITTTWRLSSTNPNLQNIPNSNWIAWEIRWAFISRYQNWKIISLDYSQVEVRILAIMSGDKNLIDAFKNWLDIHHRTAQFIFPDKVISNSERKIAKWVNFWVIYWISWFWLSNMLWISIKDAKLYIDKFFQSYPDVKIFLDNTIKFCEENKYVETLFWRRRYINWINDLNRIVKWSAEREAINMPIQWTSADIIKIAMIKAYNFIEKNNLKSKLIMQVHDELVFDTYPWEEKIIEKEIKEIMQNVIWDKSISLKVDTWIWNNWKDTK
jgi:DNA polymerase-1